MENPIVKGSILVLVIVHVVVKNKNHCQIGLHQEQLHFNI